MQEYIAKGLNNRLNKILLTNNEKINIKVRIRKIIYISKFQSINFNYTLEKK